MINIRNVNSRFMIAFAIVLIQVEPCLAKLQDQVPIRYPTTGSNIPRGPGSVNPWGGYILNEGPGVVQVDIYANDAQGLVTGPSLSSGSTAVAQAPTANSWAVTLNSPTQAAGGSYTIGAQLLYSDPNANGQIILEASSNVVVTSS